MIAASAPARVDLAGGTLDLWPLSVLHEGAATVNFAIARRQTVRLSRVPEGFEVRAAEVFRYRNAREARGEPEAALAAEACLAAGLADGVRVEMVSSVPKGSGLGGSSAMLVALVGALDRLTGAERTPEEFVAFCRDVETRVLRAPAGIQDYESALRGGLHVLEFRPGGSSVRRPALAASALAPHLVLFDTEVPHASGLNNWEVYRSRVDGDAAVIRALDGIRDAARRAAEAADAGEIEALGRAMAMDWECRRRLSPRVSTPLVEEAVRRAEEAGAWGARACGAGGGGVVAALAPADRRAGVSAALSRLSAGAIFDAGPEEEGLCVEV